MIVERFQPEAASAWNEFIENSRNGTFLLDRRYMEYHSDRFTDHSLLIRDERGDLVGVLPANQADGRLVSHGGLTYGGLVVGPKSGSVAALAMLTAVQAYLRENGLRSLLYKTIPWIYHRQPAEEDRYALFRLGAQLVRRDVLSVVPRDHRLKYQERRARGVKGAAKAGVKVEESTDFTGFWAILDENLRARYGVGPVHSLDEIERLHALFPERIRLFVAWVEGHPVAGVVVYESAQVAHVQYISANETGKRTHALDAVFDHLLSDRYCATPYFDFGISNEQNGQVLNTGLVEQKEGFGARSVCHDYYELSA